MPNVLALKDGRVETLFEVRHFEELIEKYMGYESVQYFRELMAAKDEAIEELREDYEAKLDDLNEHLADLEEKMEERDCDKQ